MPDDCDPLIRDDFAFPRKPANRPALDRIAYRIGEYPDMLEAMIRQIDRETALSAWTHRGADDPGIALLEGVAMLGDILTFYQERYANEAFLRTATWRESIADLVRLTGYRLAPALGGRATLAIEVKPGRPVTVPKGFPVKADLEDAAKPAEFQTGEEITAWPHLSRFNLYRKRHYPGSISKSRTTVEIATAGGSSSQAAIAALDLKAGDRLMLLSDPPTWESGGSSFSADQKSPQILKVKEVESLLGRTIVTFETPFDTAWSAPVTAYRLDRTFRHYGHAAPATFTRNIKDSTGAITGAREKTTGYLRHVRPGHACANTSADRNQPGREIPLDQEVQDLAVGGRVIVETKIEYSGTTRSLTVTRKISRLTGTSMGFAQQTSPVTILRMGAALLRHTGIFSAEADVRDYRIHEVTSPKIELRPKAAGFGGKIHNGNEALWFYGTREEVREIAGRRITLQHDQDKRAETLTCVNERSDFTGGGSEPGMWPLSFDAPPELFRRGAFREDAPGVTVLGNLVEVNEGKEVPVEVLGNGDARASFQTFKLPKPLTYHLSPGATPPQVPELTVYIENRVWERVPSLFGQPPEAQIYIVREDAESNSWVQFGDGKTGARLPSGVGNVSAGLRTGSGARGPLKPDADPSQSNRIAEVKKLAMPEGVHGGADREEGGNARLAAPGKVQGLDRLVSIADYETELMTIPGVARVRAEWDILDGVPGVALRVLLDAGREAEFEAVRATMRSYQKCRGPNRFALVVEQAFLRQVFLDLRYGLDARFLAGDVEAALIAALAPMDAENGNPKGLFAMRARKLGGREYATHIEGIANQVEGVTFAHVTALGMFSAAISRADDIPSLPPAPRTLNAQLLPAKNELLALRQSALTLASAPPDVQGDCA